MKRTSIFPHVRKRLEDRKVDYSSNRIDKGRFEKIMKQNYPEIYTRGNSYRIDMGIMNFLDFGSANDDRNQ